VLCGVEQDKLTVATLYAMELNMVASCELCDCSLVPPHHQVIITTHTTDGQIPTYGQDISIPTPIMQSGITGTVAKEEPGLDQSMNDQSRPSPPLTNPFIHSPASKELLSQFNNFLGNPNTFALLVTISSESLIPVELLQSASLAPSEPDSFDANLSQLCPHLQAKQPIYALLRRYVDAPHLVAATYVPDAAPVRQKMLFASTRHSLTRELGTEHFRDHIFATDPRDLSPLGFRENDAHARLDAPLTEEESALGAVKRAEAEAGAGAAMREIHLSKSLAMPVADDALAALREIGNGGGDGMVVLVRLLSESGSCHLSLSPLSPLSLFRSHSPLFLSFTTRFTLFLLLTANMFEENRR